MMEIDDIVKYAYKYLKDKDLKLGHDVAGLKYQRTATERSINRVLAEYSHNKILLDDIRRTARNLDIKLDD